VANDGTRYRRADDATPVGRAIPEADSAAETARAREDCGESAADVDTCKVKLPGENPGVVAGDVNAATTAVWEYTCKLPSHTTSPQDPAVTVAESLQAADVPSKDVRPPPGLMDTRSVPTAVPDRTLAFSAGTDVRCTSRCMVSRHSPV
jgi:hypothetical protein